MDFLWQSWSDMNRNLQSLSINEILSWVSEKKLPKFRAEQIYNFAMLFKDYSECTNLPKNIISLLSEEFYSTSLKIIKELQSKDGTLKYLYQLNDGNIVEGVFMFNNYGNTLCVSTQVGCRMGCVFCASGIGGLIRNLDSGEILGQVLIVNKLNGGTLENRKITNVVLMGSGEPLDNYDNTLNFIKDLSSPKCLNISPRNISLSTSGLIPQIYDLANENLPINLTISLHATTDEKRSEIMPINKSYSIKSLITAAKYYFEITRRRLIFEYSLIKGKNCDIQNAEELVSLMRGLPCHVNIINLNYVKEKGLYSADKESIKEFVDVLENNNISVTVRRSMGADIDGACGQLRRDFLQTEQNIFETCNENIEENN